jgi:hypothetical protein
MKQASVSSTDAVGSGIDSPFAPRDSHLRRDFVGPCQGAARSAGVSVLDEGSLSNDLSQSLLGLLIDLRSFAHLKTDKAILRRFVPCPRTDCLRKPVTPLWRRLSLLRMIKLGFGGDTPGPGRL